MTSKEALKMVQRYSNGNIILIDNQIVNLDECFNTIKADLEVAEILKNKFGLVAGEGITAENVCAMKIIKDIVDDAICLYFKEEKEYQKLKERFGK